MGWWGFSESDGGLLDSSGLYFRKYGAVYSWTHTARHI